MLLALVDANYRFIVVDVGAYGRNSDGGIFANSALGKAILNGEFKFPPNKCLAGTNDSLPHVIVGDEAFPLNKHVMRPYPGSQIKDDESKKIFNYRMSRARRLSENGFGIVTQKCRILQRRLQMSPEHVDKVILAACCLHNFIKTDTSFTDDPVSTTVQNRVDESSPTLTNLKHIGGNVTREALYVRDKFRTYFVSDAGALEWQEAAVRKGLRSK